MSPLLIDTLYLLSIGLILFGAWSFLTRDRAARGAIVVACGLLLALLCTLAADEILSPGTALVGLALGGALGAFLARGTTPDLEPGRLALLIACSSFAVALVSPIRLHEVGAVFDARGRALDEEWKGLPDALRRENVKVETVRIPLRMTMPAVMATLLGGVATGASVISALKLSRSPIRKSLPKLDEPRLPQVGAAVVALLLAMLFTAWPLMETFLWLELLTGLALGYLLTIHLKISDSPPVLATALGTAGLALSAAGLVLGNIVMVIAGALVAAGGVAAAESLCTSMNVSLPGLLLGTQSSKTSAAVAEDDGPPPVSDPQARPPRVPTATADPDAPII